MRSFWKIVSLGVVLLVSCFGCGTGVGFSTLTPTIKEVSPQTIAVGTPGLTMTVKGAGFDRNSTVLWNQIALTTQVIDDATLAAPVAGSQLTAPGVAQLSVRSTNGQSTATPITVVSASHAASTSLAIQSTALASGQVQQVYTAILHASGGTPNYIWSIKSGSLPAGLNLAANTGVISGTPNSAGTFTFTVQATDSSSPAQTQSVATSISISPSGLAITSAALAGGQKGTAYSEHLKAGGGSPNYTWSIQSGSLPAGLSLNANSGVISGTPTVVGMSSFTLQVTDSGSPAQTQSVATSISISPAGLAITSAALANGQKGTAYSERLKADGGSPNYTWSIQSGSLPAGLSLNANNGAISGVPTAAGISNFTVQVTDSSSPAQAQSVAASISISPSALAITSTSLAAGQKGSTYSATLQAGGGTPNYTWSIRSGSLPAGLSLNATNGVISGTPTTAVTSNFTVQVADSGSPAQTQSAASSITINPSTLAITSASLAGGQKGTAYSAGLQAGGGTPNYTWSIQSGSLPAGLSLNASTGAISGTPATPGISNFTVQVADSGSPAQTQSAATSITISPSTLAITSVSLAGGQKGTAYSAGLQAGGGVPNYTWSVQSGSLPAGLSLNASNGVISGNPTVAGSSSFTVQVTDSGAPAQTQSAATSITISPSTLAIAPASLASGQKGAAYSAGLQAAGGTPNYTWSVQSGSLPAGLNLNASTGAISGTPTAAGSSNFTVQVADSGSPAQTQSTPTSITISPATLAITSASLASGQNGSAYTASLQAGGGTPNYTWSIQSGSLPAGLTLSANTGVISGTPTTTGSSNFTVQVADSASPAQTQSATTSITISPSALAIASGSLVSGQKGSVYSAVLQANGGTPSYTWSIKSGSLPAGLNLNASTGVISGTATAAGTSNFTVQVVDTGSPAQTQTAAASITINPSALAITSASLSGGQKGTSYSGSLQANGGTPGYTWSVQAGSLPAGLSLNASTGVISGTPTAVGTSNFTVQAVDTGSPAQTQSSATFITISAPGLAITSGSFAGGQKGTAYAATLQAGGGTPSYTWSLKSGSLPAGLSLNPSTGGIFGTPTAVGVSSFTMQVTDAGSPAQVQTAAASITISPSALAITSASLDNGQKGSAYAATLQAGGGTPNYTWSIASGSLPAGLSLNPNGSVSGTPTSAGTSFVTVQVTDSGSPVQMQTGAVSITIAPATLVIPSVSLVSGQKGTVYTASLQANGGTPNYTWSLKSGSLPAGLSLNANGGISGTPSATGTSNFTVQVADNGSPAQTQSAAASIVINPSALAITSASFANGQKGTSYSGTLQANGGTPTYTWSIQAGSLPAGLSLNAGTGAISGTPSAAGSSSFTVQVTDSGSPAQTQSIATSMSISPSALAITSASLSGGQKGTAYSAALQAAGGTPNYIWSIQAGSLPTGLTLNTSTGVISGTPTTAGSSSFTIQVADSGSPAQTQSTATSITVNPSGLAITSALLAGGQKGTAYAATLQAAGGTPNYIWSLKSGSLPGGLTLNASTGAITGTPTTAGTSTFTAQVTDSGSPAQTQSAAASITISPSALTIASGSLVNGQKGTSYSGSLQVDGGTPNYTWSLKSGSLPAGLSLSASTGMISGTATTAGTSTFTVQVTDSGSPAQSQSVTASIMVSPSALVITSASPVDGQNGTTYAAGFQAAGGTPNYTWSLKSGSLPSGLSMNPSTGAITGTPTAAGFSAFAVQVTDSGSPAQSQSAAASITINPSALVIASASFPSGESGAAYSATLQANGGTPGYTWSLKSGSLPAGLTLSPSGAITGTPSAGGTSSFTVQVTDTGSPSQAQIASASITINPAPSALGTTWYIRADGGTRYDANNRNGQCDGKHDAGYLGSGVNQPCAFGDFRYLYDDQHTYPTPSTSTWAISGGDTVIIDNTKVWTVGWDNGSNGNDTVTGGSWCSGTGNLVCYNPTIPSGTATQPTRFLGRNYQNCSLPSGGGNHAQMSKLLGQYGIYSVFNAQGSQYVDVECLDIGSATNCVVHGSPNPNPCNTSSLPFSNYAQYGLSIGEADNLTVKNTYVHSVAAYGIYGYVTGTINMTGVDVAYTGATGINFDDGTEADAPNGNWTFHNGSIKFAGCSPQYPATSAIPISYCFDQNSGDNGDGLGTPNVGGFNMDIQNSIFAYNTEDCIDPGHVDSGSHTLTLKGNLFYGCMGASYKWGENFVSTIIQNNLSVGNCARMSVPLAGAPSTYNKYLSLFCRAGDALAANQNPGDSLIFENNTVVTYHATLFSYTCSGATSCASATMSMRNNIFLAYVNPSQNYTGGGGPGFWADGPGGSSACRYVGNVDTCMPTLTRDHNLFYNLGHGFACPTGFGSELCSDPQLMHEPLGQGANFIETELDNFNFNLTSGSPAVGGGVTIADLSTDYNGDAWALSPAIGAVEYEPQ